MRQGVDKTKKTTLKFTLDCGSVRWVERPLGGSFPWFKKEIVQNFGLEVKQMYEKDTLRETPLNCG